MPRKRPPRSPAHRPEPEVIARLGIAPARHMLGIALLLFLGGFILWMALSRAPDNVWLWLSQFLFGIGALWLSMRMANSRHQMLELTETELRMTDGTSIARLDRISGINRGALALKPTNGFHLTLDRAEGRAWVPGLWWRIGRSVGVGGLTGRTDGRLFADRLAAEVARVREARDADPGA